MHFADTPLVSQSGTNPIVELHPGNETHMDIEVETAIVKALFNKSIQERVLSELCSPDKRRNRGLNRLCHNYRQTLREEYLIKIPAPNSDPKQIADLLQRNGAEKTCYAISWNTNIDGKHLSLEDALESAVGYGFPSLILCVPYKLAYFEAELESGSPPRFLVKK